MLFNGFIEYQFIRYIFLPFIYESPMKVLASITEMTIIIDKRSEGKVKFMDKSFNLKVLF